MEKNKKRKKWPLKIKILYSAIAVLAILATGLGAVTVYGQYLLDKFDRSGESESIVIAEDKFDTEDVDENLETVNPADIKFNESSIVGRTESGVYNILLLGDDTREDACRGNTDAIMVATIDTNKNQVRITSFMRDMYVEIPGYTNNKLNSAYAKGGIPLMYEVFSTNFNLDLDGYLLVNFSDFEDIIDMLGGVTIEISKEEADYLNTTNYIDDKSQRTVIAGEQDMTGNQALGYARIRYIGNYDYERTQRQRTVLTAIFEKFRNKNFIEMASILQSVIPYVKTDLSSDEMLTIARKALSADLSDIQTFRIPIDGTIKDANVNGMAVLIVDFEKNIEAAHDFIFDGIYPDDSLDDDTDSVLR